MVFQAFASRAAFASFTPCTVLITTPGVFAVLKPPTPAATRAILGRLAAFASLLGLTLA